MKFSWQRAALTGALSSDVAAGCMMGLIAQLFAASRVAESKIMKDA